MKGIPGLADEVWRRKDKEESQRQRDRQRDDRMIAKSCLTLTRNEAEGGAGMHVGRAREPGHVARLKAGRQW